MRLTIWLLLCGCLGVQASGFAQKVNISVRNESVERVCLDIKKQTGFFFLYDTEVLKRSGNVTLDLKNVELREALDRLTSGKALNYHIIDKTVIISETKAVANKSIKDIIIQGKVTSKETSSQPAAPIPGVTVQIKGTNKAVVTDANGSYSIQVPADAVLVFSMIGYSKQEVSVANKQTIDVVLEETVSELKEVIITGYGTSERKENQVGSAIQINRLELDRKPLDRIDRLLEGVVPGLQFEVQGNTATSARPRYQTRIRGEASFSSSNEPLWVLDGIPINTGNETNMIPGVNTSVSPLTYLNPNDIESVTVLKDATATSIYGANGANGVILITTKRGKAGDDRIDYSFRTGLNLLTNKHFQVLNADEYRELAAESFANSTLKVNPIVDKGTSTNWYKEYFRTGVTTQHDISFSGGKEKTRYYVSGSYMSEKPIMIKNSTDRYSSRINLNQTVNKAVEMFFRLGASYNVNKFFDPGDTYYNNRPIDSPYNPDGSYVLAFYNKIPDAEYNDDGQKAGFVNGSIGGTLTITPDLTFTTTNGIDYSSVTENRYESTYTFIGRGDPYAYKSQATSYRWNSQQRINYDKTIKKHRVSVLLGGEASDTYQTSVGATGWGFPNDKIREIGYATNTTGTSSATDQSALSYYGQFKYSYDDKYNLIGSFRGDANSDFGSDVQWATFKSIGASWTISNEKFWHVNQLDFAKIKISYGNNGNSRIGAYKSKGIYSFSTSNSYNGNPGAIMTNGENPALSWETTNILNTGISIGFLKRISLEVEYYRNTSKDLIDQIDVTRSTGFTRIQQNIGSVRNSGIEVTLNTQNIDSKNFKWTTRFNLAHNDNKVLKLYNGNDKVGDIMIKSEGHDLNTYYLIRWAGVDPRDGAPLWYDARGNITRDFDLNNRVADKSSTPTVFGGMTNYFTYKGLTLSGLLIYDVGGYFFSGLQRDSETDGRNLASDNQSRNQLDRWREPGDLALAPKPILGENANSGRNSTRFLHEKTSLKLQNISLNYNLPKNVLSKIKLKNASVYVQGDNIGFWTPYETRSDRNDYSNSANPYPQPMVLSFGLNVGL